MKAVLQTLIWYCLLTSIAYSGPCPEYTVIKVNGLVTYKSKPLKLGDKIDITNKERLSFDKDASIQVCAPGCQPASLEISKTRENSLASLISTIRAQLSFGSKPRTTARRGEDYQSLQQWFAVSEKPNHPNPFLIIGQGAFPIHFSQFIQSSDRFFGLKYTYQGQTIYKKLPYDGDILLMISTSIYTIDGRSINPLDVTNTQLIYLSTKTNQETYICHFQPVFVEPEVLEKALTPLVNAVASQISPEALYVDYILPFVLYNYGSPEESTLKKLLHERFGIIFP